MVLTDIQVKNILNRVKTLQKLGVPRDLIPVLILVEFLG